MKFVADKAALNGALKTALPFAERRDVIPILGCAKIVAADGRICVSATDLDKWVDVGLAASITVAGEACVPIQPLAAFVAGCSDGAQIEVDGAASTIVLRSGRARCSLNSLAVEDFPEWATGTKTAAFEWDCAALARLIDETGFAVSSGKNARPHLRGVLLQVGRQIEAWASDGHVASVARFANDAGGDAKALIGADVLGALARALRDAKAKAVVAWIDGGRLIEFRIEDVSLRVKVLDYGFPDVARLWPSVEPSPRTVSRRDISSAVDRAIALEPTAHRLALSFSDGELALSCRGTLWGEHHDSIELSGGKRPIEVAFNCHLLRDVLASFDDDEIEFHCDDGASTPWLICGQGNIDAHSALIMPMR